ncbi:MAG TPA: tRNA lysidine(34) synthetase TilS [Xanthobacteraceae bacterium]|nr:tRNA lysidine(34) synthetase TilS [Xanthobacteraceae bacterium]
MPTAERAVRTDEAIALFSGLENLPGLVLAVSGGPDSTALLVLAARWAKAVRRAPKLLAVTVDHALRAQSAGEAAAVKRLARRLGVSHRTLNWRGKKPKSGLQEAARGARYRLLAQAAREAGYDHVLTAHTLDDQAETVLFRLARGSGLAGLGGMAYAAPLPDSDESSLFLVRPFLGLPKARLIATLAAAGIAYTDDPTNRDPRFFRARLRAVMPALAKEGLDPRGLSRLAMRLRRAEGTIEFAVAAAGAALAPGPWPERGPIAFPTVSFAALPAEVGLRLLGRAVAHSGDEGPVELGKLEALYDSLRQAPARLRRTLAGALVTLDAERLTVERAPPRRSLAIRKNRNRRFTK